MRTQNRMPHLVSNPGMFSINEITFGFVNTDVVKDMCVNMVVKTQQNGQPQKPKIDLVLQSMLQQKSFYPLYPASGNVPIEWQQYQGMMFTEKTPDVLITPSDLMNFAKVSFL